MAKTHWKKLQNPNYLGAYELQPGQELTLTISKVKEELVIGSDGKKENCSVMYFAEKGVKPMILNVTNSKTIAKLYGSPYVEDWAGKAIIIYSTEVKAFGEIVEALRIRDYLPKLEKYTCSDCDKEITPEYGMTAENLAKRNQKKYGRPLCAKCAIAAKEAEEKAMKEGDLLNESDENKD